MGRPRVVVVGAGPGGMAAAARLRERGGGSVEIVLVTSGGTATHLAGTVATALGVQASAHYSAEVRLDGVTLRAAEVAALDGAGVWIGAERIDADAVIAAPGLIPDPDAVPSWSRARAGWSPAAGEAAAAALEAVPGGHLLIVICALPYRCPPAPYGLAMALAHRHRTSGRFTKVTLTTPEAFPLMGVGGEAPAFLMEACAGAGVSFEGRFEPDLAASEDGVLRAHDGRALEYELAFFVPPHGRAPMLRPLGGAGPLVAVGDRGESAQPGLFVVGDAVDSGLPRAAAVAEAQGVTAADAVLAGLGLAAPEAPVLAQPCCYVAHGGGSVSRIRIRYDDGLPPLGAAHVSIDLPSPDLAHAAEGERRRFLALSGCR